MLKQSTAPSRQAIDQLNGAVATPMAVRAALQLDLFSPLSDRPMTVEELADALDVKPRRLRMLLYQLVLANFLEYADDKFANTPMADYYFVKGKPNYLGRVHGLWTEIWSALLYTADSIRSDIPHAKIDFAGMSQAELGGFLRGLHGNAMAAGRHLAANSVFANATKILDVGGGSGGVSIAVSEMHPQLITTLLELPPVIPIAQEMIAEASFENRITPKISNLLSEPLSGDYDIALARNFFQVLSEEQCRVAVHNIATALTSGATFFIIGHICDDDHLSPENCVSTNLFFLNAFDDGEAYTEAQYKNWLGDVGFSNITREPFLQGTSLITAQMV